MKTRSNDIIPNAPFSYNSSTNTFEIGTNLYVDGITDFGDEVNLSVLNIKQVLDDDDFDWVKISYNKDSDRLAFDFTGRGLTYYLEPNLSDGNIVSSDNVKTLFGNQSLIGKGNIDLYRHQLKVKVGGNAVYFVITSSSNLKVASLQDLTTVTKATNGYFTLAIRPGETNDSILVTYNNNVWGSSIGAITAITEDVVQPI